MEGRIRRLVTAGLAVAVVLSLGGVVYLSLTAGQSADPYTEFYVLGTSGNASDYPTNLTVGETGTVVVGIANHEHRSIAYTVELRLDGRSINTTTVNVDDDETWEGEFTFTPETPGRLRLRIVLFATDDPAPDAEPYRALRLWIHVRE